MTRLLPTLTAAVLVGAIVAPSSASAYGRLSTESGSLFCATATACDGAVDCVEPTSCLFAVGLGGGVCLGEDDVVCATGVELCPTGFSGRPLGGFRICVPDAETDRVCAGLLAQCFLDSDGEVVRARDGDCDSDGVPNRDELAGEHCNPAPTLGLIDDGDCRPIGACVDGDCEDDEACTLVEPAGHKYCLVAGDEPEFCCDEETSCPSMGSCILPGTVPAVACGVSYCRTAAASVREQCYREPEGDRTINPDTGDCDGDGTNNLTESLSSPGSECVHADANRPDAGSFDAGSADAGALDAGVLDAGTTDGAPGHDADPGREVTFGGGGGCVCRAAPDGPPRGGLLVALMVGVVTLRRRYGA